MLDTSVRAKNSGLPTVLAIDNPHPLPYFEISFLMMPNAPLR